MILFIRGERLTTSPEYNVKAREMTFNLSKIKSDISMERVSFILIDQVRANMKIESRFQAATNEKGVGDFGNYKSATAVSALQHNLRQWLWISKGKKLKVNDPMGIDGWIMHAYTEKNKLAPSQFFIPLVFDKKWGVIPFFSEFIFLAEKTKTEMRYWPNPKKLIYPFSIVTSANSRKLVVVDPNDHKNILYDSGKFMMKNAWAKYQNDQEFHHWFDKAVDIAIDQRIKQALFRDTAGVIEIGQTNPNSDLDEIDSTDESIASAFDNISTTEAPEVIDPHYEQQISEDDVQEQQVSPQPVNPNQPQSLGESVPQDDPQPPADEDGGLQIEEDEVNPFLVPD